MIDFIKKSVALAFAFVTGIFTFVPEAFFGKHEWVTQETLKQDKWFNHLDVQDVNIVISRLVCFLLVWGAISLLYMGFLKICRWITIKGQNYSIRVEYGNILTKRKCKRVINFDECFTTKVGSATPDVKPNSICGQYLSLHPDLDVQQLIETSKIKPAGSKSKYLNKTRYDSGTIVPNGDDLLMAFAKLDERGKGRFFSRDEYLVCLDLLWKELENHNSEKDICVPVLGAGTTTFDGGSGASISQQDLLDMMIWSYKLSSHKIKAPHKLRIVCKKNSGFSINNIGK
ncbi:MULTISPECIES: macro domain-containing protein [Clostridium]|uniref:Thoeris protein ThsA Macro domain-containing protein n=1 Tax=Clostridium perfringens TaxID=1502 RepID=A0A140GT69_CLOPF|nr:MULTISPECIES: macro domain-containing protein [Clostridium]AMN36763.1 hypothetical protein JFP838_13755 [Clostridium perfringens]MBI6053438.1 hypothetical protein [Clostridium perfringens]MDK7590690.1 DUF6430 domain-containing protein [Clostridium sp. UMB9555B]MDK7629131.1 DUF6430 domain-containing protein [Clostridium sp. UMB9555A]